MIIGVPKEIKNNEGRVAMTPASAEQFVDRGHTVLIERSAGEISGFTDQMYELVGAKIVDKAKDVWGKSQMIYKVKEPLKEEYKYFRDDLILFTYLHLAAEKELTQALLSSKITAIAYETVQKEKSLPLLKPMSEVAGRMAVQEGARFLSHVFGGKGVLLDGFAGIKAANVVILGAGVAGSAATKVAVGMGARVTVLDLDLEKLEHLLEIFPNKIETRYSNSYNIEEAVTKADLVISTVLIPGHKAPQLISEDMVKKMQKGSVIVDVAIDQGGSTDLTKNHVTSHTDPVFVAHDVIHYSVTNIPGAVPKTSTEALSNATTKYALAIADYGYKEAFRKYPELEKGLNVSDSKIRYEPVAKAFNLKYEKFEF